MQFHAPQNGCKKLLMAANLYLFVLFAKTLHGDSHINCAGVTSTLLASKAQTSA
jgi:hypothetical protein